MVLLIAVTAVPLFLSKQNKKNKSQNYPVAAAKGFDWKAPDESTIPAGKAGDQVRYGKELIAHTSLYFGPKGKVASISNGMNCQNCHNQAGTKAYGFDFAQVATTFPQFNKRSGSVITIAQRINSCFDRSLNGKSPDSNSKEIQAMIAYMKWVGKDVPEGVEPSGAGVLQLKYLDRAADPGRGKIIYVNTCQVCHGKDGQGHLDDQGTEYIFPPLWGSHSYNDGAGLYRLEAFAGFVKGNMPFGTTYHHPLLTDEQSWDVAAFVNSQPHPHKDQSKDYAVISDKSIDDPFGPYADHFTEKQHKYGPYPPILAEKNELASHKK